MKKLITIFLLVAAPIFTFAQTPLSSDLQALIRDLQAQIQALQKQVKTLEQELGKSPEPTTPAVTSTPEVQPSQPEATPPELTRSLSRGSSGDDVRKLQEFLARDKEIYPNGLITGFFGPLTEVAVKKWQEKQGIESVGIVGPKTIAKLQELGKGVVQGLIERGAGVSGIIPPGLLTAPGVQPPTGASLAAGGKKFETATTTQVIVTSTLAVATTTTSSIATTTPSGTIPATPATPATQTSQPATPATPAVPATTTTTSTTSSDTILPTISGVGATNVTSSSATIAWTTNKPTDSQVEYGLTGAYGSITTLDTSLVTSHSAQLSQLTANATYYYRIKSKDAAGNLATWTQWVTTSLATTTTTTTTSSDTTSPSVPTNLVATVISSSQINLSWSASTDNTEVTGYKVYRDGSLFTSSVLSPYSNVSLIAGTSYSYTVVAYDAAGNVSAQSSPVSVSTLSQTASTTVTSTATTTTSSAPNNSVLAIIRLFPGQYDNTKYSLSLSDPDGIGDLNVNKASGSYIWSGSPRSGNPPCPAGPIETGTLTLNPSDFPLSGYVIDCLNSGVQYPVQVSMPALPAASTPLPAPTYIRGDWSYGWWDIYDNTMGQRLTFQYPIDSSSKSTGFRLYYKRPGDSAFALAAEFSGLDSTQCLGTNVSPYSVGEWILDRSSTCGSWVIYHVKSGVTNPYVVGVGSFSASSFSVGEYSYYVSAVGANGSEGNFSATTKLIFLQPLTITSPTSAQSPTSPTPTFQWTNGSGWLVTPSLSIRVFESNGSNPYWSSAYSSFSPTVYSGPALGSGKTYRVSVYGIHVDTSTPGWSSSLALPASITDFWISTTTSFLDTRAKNLAAISQALDAIREKLTKLLHGF